jgi:hypothetical protein
MSRLARLASVVVVVAVISVACAETSGQSNSANSMLTGPSVFAAATSGGAAVSVPAAKGGNGKGKLGDTSGGSITGPVEVNGDGLLSLGDLVTFDVSTTATAYPWVTVKCYQDGGLVSQESRAMFLGTLYSRTFTLGPTPNWQSGGADCTATLESWDEYSNRGRITALASLPFAVAP